MVSFRAPGRALRTPPSYSGDLPTGRPNSREPQLGFGPPPEGLGLDDKGKLFLIVRGLSRRLCYRDVHAHAEPIVSFAWDAIRGASKECAKRMCRYNVK